MDLILLFIAHFIADFALQPREMALKKSEDYRWLLRHCAIHFGVFWCAVLPFLYATPILFLLPIGNSIVHGVIDWNIWRGYKKWKATHLEPPFYEDHYFYFTLGADQLLHALTIVGLWLVLV